MRSLPAPCEQCRKEQGAGDPPTGIATKAKLLVGGGGVFGWLFERNLTSSELGVTEGVGNLPSPHHEALLRTTKAHLGPSPPDCTHLQADGEGDRSMLPADRRCRGRG